MALPESEVIAKYRYWRVFGTGTWSSPEVPSDLVQRRLVFAFLYRVSDLSCLPYRRLVWALRHERGEKTGREHYHWLIGAQEWTPTLTAMFQMNHLWDNLPKCGFSRNHLFNPALNGVEYVTKCLSGSALVGSVGGDFYESSKFGSARSEVTLSNSLVRVVAGRRVSVLRH